MADSEPTADVPPSRPSPQVPAHHEVEDLVATMGTAVPSTAPVEPGANDLPHVQTEISWKSAWRLVGVVLVVLLCFWVVTTASTLFAMVGISFFFSLALDPGVRSLHQRYGWRRGAAVGVIYLAGIVFTGFLLLVLIPAIGQVAAEISTNFDDWVNNLRQWMESTFGLEGTRPLSGI